MDSEPTKLELLDSADSKKPQAGYMPQLDALRAIAVISVAFSHWVPKPFQAGLPFGSSGVQLFFVLSGFLITGILLRCRAYENPMKSLKGFYGRRFVRIFPLFYVTLLIVAILNLESIRDSIWWHVAYLSNFLFFWQQDWQGNISHFWSLAVEEQFYLFWPTIILFAPGKRIGLAIYATIFVGIVFRFGAILLPDFNFISVLPFANLDSLGLGALLAWKQGSFGEKLDRWLAFSMPAFVLLFFFRHLVYEYPNARNMERLCLLISFTWMILWAARGFKGVIGKVLLNPVLIYLGKISYGLYIIHNFAEPVVYGLAEKTGWSILKYGPVSMILFIVFTISLSAVSWKFLEAPLNQLKRHFPYK